MAWPMKVARNAPAMPSTVVRMNPLGLFGPGESSRAIIPAMKPTMITQRMPLMAVVLPQKSRIAMMIRDTRGDGAARIAASDPARQFAFGRHPSVRRQMIDDVGQVLAEATQQFVARQPALRRQIVDLIGAERLGEIAGRNRFVRARAHPCIGGLALAVLLELLEQIAEPAADHASGRAAREQTAQSALQQIAKTSA